VTHSLTHAIHEHIIAYLAGEQSLPEFHDWLVGATWNVEDQGDSHAVDLSYDIKLAVAEHSRGDISLSDLRERLSALVATAQATAGSGVVPT
jgi:hypothetical protein